jgi:hypothetical protein
MSISSNEGPRVSGDAIANALKEVNASKRRGGRAPLPPEEKAAREVEAQRKKDAAAQRRLDREAKKDAAKDRPVHMKKLARAAEKLPSIGEDVKQVVENVFERFPTSEITGLVAHCAHRLRTDATIQAQKVTVSVGDLVRIADPSNRHNGELARVTKVQRIRCYVSPLRSPERSVYLFTSMVERVEEASNVSTDVTDEPFQGNVAAG